MYVSKTLSVFNETQGGDSQVRGFSDYIARPSEAVDDSYSARHELTKMCVTLQAHSRNNDSGVLRYDQVFYHSTQNTFFGMGFLSVLFSPSTGFDIIAERHQQAHCCFGLVDLFHIRCYLCSHKLSWFPHRFFLSLLKTTDCLATLYNLSVTQLPVDEGRKATWMAAKNNGLCHGKVLFNTTRSSTST